MLSMALDLLNCFGVVGTDVGDNFVMLDHGLDGVLGFFFVDRLRCWWKAEWFRFGKRWGLQIILFRIAHSEGAKLFWSRVAVLELGEGGESLHLIGGAGLFVGRNVCWTQELVIKFSAFSMSMESSLILHFCFDRRCQCSEVCTV